jgi:hypothetical protein
MSKNTRIPFEASDVDMFNIDTVKAHLQEAFGKRMTVTTADALSFAVLSSRELLEECRCYADAMPYDFHLMQTRLARFCE